MAIELKKHLSGSPLSPAQQKEILELDTDRNGRLESSDLSPRFGQTAAWRFFIDLQTSVKTNNFKKFRGTMGKLEEARGQFFAKSFQAGLLEKQAELEKLGVEFQDGKLRFTGVSAENRGAAARLLAEALKGPYSGEFRGMTAEESREFLFRVETFVRVRSEADTENESFLRAGQIAERLLVEERGYWNAQARPASEQKDFAEESFHEIHTPKHVAALEKKYGIDLRRKGGELSSSQTASLDRVFSALRKIAPDDFTRLSTVTLHLDGERGGGLSHLNDGDRIDLFGPFGPPVPDVTLPASYAEDMPAFFNADTESYLKQVLAHELAHLTESKEVMSFYRKTFPGTPDRVLEERYAEDYRIFLFSDGERVATRGADHRNIGREAERLEFHRRKS